MQIKCPHCGSADVSNIYSGDIIEEDISCGMNVVKYDCECESCNSDFNCTVHYAIADIEYESEVISL